MTFDFVIDKKFILGGLLFNSKRNSPYIEICNKLWGKYTAAYDLVNRGIDYRELLLLDAKLYFKDVSTQFLELIDEGLTYPEVQQLYSEAEIYKEWIEKAWGDSQVKVETELKSILKTELPTGPFKVLLVPFIIGGGRSLGNNIIFWGDKYAENERFPNYNIIYLVHEALHSIFGKSEIEHSIIEFISDNELRLRLNGEGEYFLCNGINTGHSFLLEMEKKMLKDWKEYLGNPKININQFKENQLKKHFGRTCQ